MTKETAWGRMAFHVQNSDGSRKRIEVHGRPRWFLEALIAAGSKGCTPIETPGPRFSAYAHTLRGMGVEIETIHESHGGPFPGHHGRYCLRSQVTRAEGGTQ